MFSEQNKSSHLYQASEYEDSSLMEFCDENGKRDFVHVDATWHHANTACDIRSGRELFCVNMGSERSVRLH